jgi:small subunit ribosomal protein S17
MADQEETPMTDDTVNEGTSADAEVPGEEETPLEDSGAEPEAAATAEEAAAEAEAEPVAEAKEPAPDAEAQAAEAEPVAEAGESTDAAESGPGTSAEAEVPPAKRKKKRLPRSLRPPRAKPRRERQAERRPIVRLPKPEHERGRSQERQGKVVSAAMDKTIVVRVDTVKVHPRYKKVIRRSSKFHAHDERNEAKVGDIVLIVETRPISRMKRWRLQKVVEAAK